MVVFVSVLVFAAIDRGVRFDDGSAAQNTAQQGAGAPGPSKSATPSQSKRRWFVQQQGGYNMGFNIQLDADGSSGSASWPDDKNVTGTFTLEGDKLEVRLNRPMPARTTVATSSSCTSPCSPMGRSPAPWNTMPT